MGGCRCVFRNCTNSTQTAQGMHFFHFPIRDKTRCEKWSFYSDNMSFMELPDDKLRNKVICEDHFRDRCFMNYKKERLIKTAVPTILKLATGEILDFERLELDDLNTINNKKLSDTTVNVITQPLLLNSKSMQNNIAQDDEFSFTMKYVEFENDYILPDNIEQYKNNSKYFQKKKPIILNSLASGSGTTFLNKEPDIISFPLHDNPTNSTNVNNDEIIEHTENNIIIIEQTDDDIYDSDNVLEHNVLTIAAEINSSNMNNKKNESLIGRYKKRKYENKSVTKSIKDRADANKVEINKQMTNKTNNTENNKSTVENITPDNITLDNTKIDIITSYDNIRNDNTSTENSKPDNITKEDKNIIVSSDVEMIEKDIHTKMITDYEQQIVALKKLLTEKTNAIETMKANNAIENVINIETIKSPQPILTKNQLFTGIRKYLNPSMVALLRMEMFGNSEREYKTDEKLFAKELYQLEGNVYNFLQDEWRFRLPSKKEVESWLNENDLDEDEDL